MQGEQKSEDQGQVSNHPTFESLVLKLSTMAAGISAMIASYNESADAQAAYKKKEHEKELEDLEFRIVQLQSMSDIRALQTDDYGLQEEHRQRWEAEQLRHNRALESIVAIGFAGIADALRGR